MLIGLENQSTAMKRHLRITRGEDLSLNLNPADKMMKRRHCLPLILDICITIRTAHKLCIRLQEVSKEFND